jgi:hypothetical protein
MMEPMQRRTFVKNSLIGTAAIATANIHPAFAILHPGKYKPGLFIGTPVLPEYIMQRGIAHTLDEMREMADIKTVLVFSHDHVFRQYQPGFQPKMQDGKPLTNVWVKTDPNYYQDPALQGRNDDLLYGGRDVLDEIWAEAQPRDMDVYARILEPFVITGAIPGFENFAEVDANGEKRNHVCFNHPEYIAYWASVIEDLVRSHPYMHGFKFGQERGGPLLSSMGSPKPAGCFCQHCLPLARKRGINIEKARDGLLAIQDFGNRIKAREKPVDGNFVSFFRLLTQYPDLLSWEQFWMDSREEQRKRIYTQIKGINPKVQVGWHICHGMTWDLITRATWDYSKMGAYSDWLSVAVYFDSMGRRSMGHYNRNYKDILFGDATDDYSYPMYLSMLGYDPKTEPPLEAHRNQDTAFTPDYVYRECKRVVTAVNGTAHVHARPGFDMPSYDCNVQPETVYKAVTRALDAGVDGLWCGREWDELKPENAMAFGRAARDYQRKNK